MLYWIKWQRIFLIDEGCPDEEVAEDYLNIIPADASSSLTSSGYKFKIPMIEYVLQEEREIKMFTADLRTRHSSDIYLKLEIANMLDEVVWTQVLYIFFSFINVPQLIFVLKLLLQIQLVRGIFTQGRLLAIFPRETIL